MAQSVKVFIISLFLVIAGSISTDSDSSGSDYSMEPAKPDLNTDSVLYKALKDFALKHNNNLRYTFGERVENDHLLLHNSDQKAWGCPHNISIIMQYSGKGGQAVTITFVEVNVLQSTNLGAARIVAGGIGKHLFVGIIEVNSTYWLRYSANIYGFE